MSETVKRGGCGQCPYDETTCYEMKKTGGICAYDGLFVEITFDECKYRKFPTNGDRIRSMTDEQIEKWYWWMHQEMMSYTDSVEFLHQWLKQEVSE